MSEESRIQPRELNMRESFANDLSKECSPWKRRHGEAANSCPRSNMKLVLSAAALVEVCRLWAYGQRENHDV
jgi:hypothetical protein